MRIRATAIGLLAAAALAVGPAEAQTGSASKSITNDNRLFQRFIEDGAVTEGNRLEGQFRYQSFDDADAVLVSPILAFNIAEDIEIGGRIGLLTANPDPGDTETGFTDLDLYGKIRLTTQPTQLALGILIKFPSGDETKSILHGTGEIDVAFFGGLRHDFGRLSLVANAGFRVNQDPQPDAAIPGRPARGSAGWQEPEGELSLQAGGGLLFAMTEKLSGVVEVSYETERVDGIGSDFRLTLGAEYRAAESFGMRFGAAWGVGDMAPNYEAIGSAVLFF